MCSPDCAIPDTSSLFSSILDFSLLLKSKLLLVTVAPHLCLSQACTLARRNAEVFLKYIHRNNVSMPSAASHTRGPEQQVKGQCKTCFPRATLVETSLSCFYFLEKKKFDVGWCGQQWVMGNFKICTKT